MMSDKKKKKNENPEPESGGQPQGNVSEITMMAISIEEYEAMQRELETCRTQAKEMTDGWARERADFQNFRRMVDRDAAQQSLNIKGEIIKKYLPIIDDMELALKSRPVEGSGAAWSNGVDLIYRKLQNILESEGVQKIAAEHQAFDPNNHQAITHEDSPDHESGSIIEVVRQGYIIGDRVIRPALVRVAI